MDDGHVSVAVRGAQLLAAYELQDLKTMVWMFEPGSFCEGKMRFSHPRKPVDKCHSCVPLRGERRGEPARRRVVVLSPNFPRRIASRMLQARPVCWEEDTAPLARIPQGHEPSSYRQRAAAAAVKADVAAECRNHTRRPRVGLRAAQASPAAEAAPTFQLALKPTASFWARSGRARAFVTARVCISEVAAINHA
jgi:hypothetical protein